MPHLSRRDRISRELEAMNEASRTTKAKLWPRISGQSKRSEFRLRVFVLKVLIRVLRRSMSALQLGRGDSAAKFPVPGFDREKPKARCQNHWLLQQITKADSVGIEQHHAPPEMASSRSSGQRCSESSITSTAGLLFAKRDHKLIFVPG
jgi:hypothetical protein